MAEYTLKDFDFLKVSSTFASIGYKDANGNIHIARNIELSPDGKGAYTGYATFDDNVSYGFYSDGNAYDIQGNFFAKLGIVETTITKTTGTKLVRETNSDGTSNARPFPRYGTSVATETSSTQDSSSDAVSGEVFSIATLQPREEIAMHCLESMLHPYDNPLLIDNTKIKLLVEKSFLFAQEFINQAVLYREKETTSSTAESSKYASVDSDSLSSDTDKLLYNISTALTNMMAQSKNQYADQQRNGLKVSTTDLNIKTTFPDTIHADISGSISAEVSGSVSSEVSGSITTKSEGTPSETT